MSEAAKGLTLILLSAVCFSAKAVLVKLAYRELTDSVTILALRMVFSAPFFAVLFYLNREKWKKADLNFKDYLSLASLGILGYYLSSLFDFIGLEYITASLERLILYTYPSLVALINWIFYRRKPGRREYFSLVLTYIGVFLIFSEIKWDNRSNSTGIFFVFLCSLTYAVYVARIENIIKKLGAVLTSSAALIISTFAIVLHFLLTRDFQVLKGISLQTLEITAVMAVISTVIPTILFSAGLKRIGSGKAAIASTLGPVSTIIMAYFILGEKVSVLELSGSVFIIYGILLLGKKKEEE